MKGLSYLKRSQTINKDNYRDTAVNKTDTVSAFMEDSHGTSNWEPVAGRERVCDRES